MIRTIALAAALLLPLAARAQPAQVTPEQQALGITSWIAQMVQELAAVKAQNAALQQELAKAKAEQSAKPAPEAPKP